MPPRFHDMTRDQLLAEMAKIWHEHEQLKKMVFGTKSERFVPTTDDKQLTLALDGVEEQPAVEQIREVSYTRSKKKPAEAPPARQPIPGHLPRVEHLIEPGQDTSGMKCIGEEVTEELEYQPGELYVNRYIRPKYAMATEQAQEEGVGEVVIAPLPSRPIERGIPGPGLLAQILVGKYADHLPLYRQCKIFERQQVTLAPATINGWVSSACSLLEPLYDALKGTLLQSSYLMADETPIRVLDGGKKGQSHRGFYWVYYDPVKRLVLFDYQPGRGKDGPQKMLKDYRGYLQSDGYNVYDGFENRGGITLLGCMAHARRKFVEAEKNDPERAVQALALFQQLYAIEKQARTQELDYQQRYQLRQERALQPLNDLKEWLTGQAANPAVTPKSPIGKAVSYTLSRWERLKAYTRDGRLEIDNNLVENAIRPVALGRKNYLFAGSHQAAQRAAVIYSLLETCRKQGKEPFAFLRDLLAKIGDYPVNQLHRLLPFTAQSPSQDS